MTPRHAESDLLVVSHSGARAGAPMVLLRLLRWLERSTDLRTDVVLLHGGSMEREFDRFGAQIIGGADSRLWMIQRGLTNLGLRKPAAALSFARQAPTMWQHRAAPLVLLNSVGSLPVLRFMPEGATSKVVVYAHELDEGFERTLGESAWARLSPKVDHFVACGDQVTEMLVERRGVDPRRVSVHHGFVDEVDVDPLRAAYVRRQLGIPLGAHVIGASGRLEWRKAPEVFVQVARAVADRRPDLDVHFVWLGGPTGDSASFKLQHDVDHADLTDRFHLTGEHQDPAAVMANFDLFALTSREEPFSLAVLEAASLGVPTVGFANGGIVELALAQGPHRPLARVVPYLDVDAMAEALAELLTQPDDRQAIADRARAHVLRRHSTERAAPALLDTLIGVEPSLARRAGYPQRAGADIRDRQPSTAEAHQ